MSDEMKAIAYYNRKQQKYKNQHDFNILNKNKPRRYEPHEITAHYQLPMGEHSEVPEHPGEPVFVKNSLKTNKKLKNQNQDTDPESDLKLAKSLRKLTPNQ